MTDIIKICKKHGELPIDNFYIYLKNNRPTYKCKFCSSTRRTKYYKNNKITIRLNQKQYRKNNIESRKKSGKEYRIKHKEKLAKYKSEWYFKKKELLTTEEMRRRRFRLKFNNEMIIKNIASRLCETHGLIHNNDIYCYPNSKRYSCRKCVKEKLRIWNLKNRERKNSIAKIWRSKNKKRCNELNKIRYHKDIKSSREKSNNYRSLNKEHINERIKKRRKYLTDNYVKGVIAKRSKLKHSDIPIEFVEVKRIHLKLKHKLKEIENVNK